MQASPLEQIETKIAFLERANTELSDVVFRQQREIEALHARLNALVEQFEAAQSDEPARGPEEERPPHY
jgi:SlyX protein